MAGRTFLMNAHKFKSLAKLRVALKHNLRENEREIVFSDRIDPSRTRLNVVLRGAIEADTIMALQKQLLEGSLAARVNKDGSRTKIRADAVQGIEFLFSLPPNLDIDEDKFFATALAWIDQRYRVPVLSAIVHRDEGDGRAHLHAVVLPVRDGCMIGSSMLGLYSAMQQAFHVEVAAHFGLTYAPRMSAISRKEVANAVTEALKMRPQLTESVEYRAWLRGVIERNPAPLLELLGLSPPQVRPREKKWVETMTRPIMPSPIVSQNPIGFENAPHRVLQLPQTKPYSVLGFDLMMPHFAISGTSVATPSAPMRPRLVIAPSPAAEATNDHGGGEHTRVPDDLPVKWFDERLGEFVVPVCLDKKNPNKKQIVLEVAAALKEAKP